MGEFDLATGGGVRGGRRGGRVHAPFPLHDQRELDPAPQLFARLRGKVLLADLELPGVGMVREHLRQGTERVVEADAVLALLEKSLQAAQDQRRTSCSQ